MEPAFIQQHKLVTANESSESRRKTGGSLNQKYLDQSYGIQLVHQLNARTSISAKYNHLFRNDKLNDSYRENSIATALMVKF